MSKTERPGAAALEVRRQTRRQYSAEDNIRVVLGGLRGEESFWEFGRREGIGHAKGRPYHPMTPGQD